MGLGTSCAQVDAQVEKWVEAQVMHKLMNRLKHRLWYGTQYWLGKNFRHRLSKKPVGYIHHNLRGSQRYSCLLVTINQSRSQYITD